jgi:pimeloyl-ACP methyl ester carboxylesterase
MHVVANGIRFEVIDEGDGPPVLLLHGFPDSAALWRHQIPALRTAGYRVIAPDLRGFGGSDRPADPAGYTMPTLIADVLGILEARGVERTAVIGHDWGAALAWALGSAAPQVVDRLAVLSVGHPAGFFTDQVTQRERSWYMLFFQFPGVAEEALRRDDWALWRILFGPHGDLDLYLVDLDRPGALTAALNWYRANMPPVAFGMVSRRSATPVRCPVLGLWSDGDHHCGEAQMLASEQHVVGSWRYQRVTGASHWLPLDAPAEVNRLLIEFLDEGRSAR